MKNIVLAAALALIAVPALAVGPQPFTVDVSRGYAVTAPGQQQEQGRSNWAPRGQQQAQEQASEEGQATAQRARATKASGKTHRRAQGAAAAAQAPANAKAPAAPAAAPAPAAKH